MSREQGPEGGNTMGFIRTVLGDIRPEEFGVCDAHEHLFRAGGPEVAHDRDFLIDDYPAAAAEVQDWIDHGGKSMVLMDPIGCGRNVPDTVRLAEEFAGKAHFVAATGFQKGDFYDHRVSFAATNTLADIVDMLCREIVEGMDQNSYNGPIVKRAKNRAGVIKAGTGYANISEFELKTMKAAALTQKETGAPISIHTQLGTMGYEDACYLKEQGADPEHVIICHVQKEPDRFYHKKILDTGVYICYDGPDRAKYFPDSVHVDNLKWLIEKGYQKKILLSMDAGRASYQKSHMARKGRKANGISYLLTRFVEELREAGIGEEAIRDMLTANAARAFCFTE